MRRSEFETICIEVAKTAFSPADYQTLLDSMHKSSLILFDYLCTRQFMAGSCQGEKSQGVGTWLTYRRLVAKKFICMKVIDAMPEQIYLAAMHELHGRKEYFQAIRIKNVREIGNIILALLNPNKYISFIDGSAMNLETTKITT